ncbi:competence protein CoiA [Priestia megaterium]|uniref:competence protein CoiA n=1 Tax=Priestia megaterium TaxID=1404 RepID=UPI0035DA0608
MLKCIDEHNNILDASRCNDSATRQLSDDKKLFCRFCNSIVIYKNGTKVKAYFAHTKKIECPTYGAEESEEHEQGKEIIYEWLKNQYPDAFIDYEYHIKATNQVADVYIEHKQGNLKGLKWAFEFQHSTLIESKWKKRHELYKQAEIQDFWILDEDIFLSESNAIGVKDTGGRNNGGLDNDIFKETDLCYLLNIESNILTIDFKFKNVSKNVKTKQGTKSNSYRYHNPPNHSFNINNVKIEVDKETSYAFLTFDKVEDDLKEHINTTVLPRLKRRLHNKLAKQLEEQTSKIKKYAETLYNSGEVEIIMSFIKENQEQVEEDIRNLENEAFFNKYGDYFNRVFNYYKEIRTLGESNELAKRLLCKRISYKEVEKISFINELGENSLEAHFSEKLANEIDIVNYAYNEHKEVLETISKYQQKRLNEKLYKIKYDLVINNLGCPEAMQTPSAMNYALGFYECKNTTEVDNYIEEIKDKVIIKPMKPISWD